MKIHHILACVATLACCTLAQADKNKELPLKVAKQGKLIKSESFDEKVPAVGKAARGTWTIVDGALHGKEVLSEEHAAVMNYTHKNRNSIVRFSFKFEDNTKGFHFSLNHRGGHLCRLSLTPTKMTFGLDKDKKDPKSKAQRLADASGKFAPGKWHTMQIEIVGDTFVAQADNGLHLKASHPKLDTDKPNYRFVMKGNSLAIDDLMIWETK